MSSACPVGTRDVLGTEATGSSGKPGLTDIVNEHTFFNNGTPEEWLMFQKDLAKVLIGQDITTGPPFYGRVRHLLKGVALRKFDESALAHGIETMLHYEDVMSDLAYCVFPMRAIQVQK
jgi:hypothetical protein